MTNLAQLNHAVFCRTTIFKGSSRGITDNVFGFTNVIFTVSAYDGVTNGL